MRQLENFQNVLIPQGEKKYFSYLYLIYIATGILYLTWRFIYTLNWHFWFSSIIFVCDIYIVVTTIIFVITSKKIFLPKWRKGLSKLTVDIFIPTYNEPVEIVEVTTIGALNVSGVNKVLVLDDGNRPEIKKMVKEVGAMYFARKDNKHAKAGNLNFGLSYSNSDLIVNLDCDHVPSQSFIERTIGYFDDPGLAFVQTPQVFYNDDSIQHRKTTYRNLWNEQTMFYESIQPAKNGFNAAFFCGSSGIIRRSALDSVGGYATDTATEDIHTSIRLHARGWRSLFVAEKLAYGLAAEDIREYHKQRVRWGAGSLGLLFRSTDSPLLIHGLTIMQRIGYIYSTTAYLFGIQKIIYFLAPIITIFSLAHPTIPLIYYFSAYLPFLLFSYFITYVYSRRTFHFPYTEQYDILNIFSNIEALKGIIRVQKKFGVSVKMKPLKEQSIVYFTLISLALLMIVTDFYGINYWRTHSIQSGNLFSSSILVGIFWNSFNLFFVVLTLLFLNDYYTKEKSEHKFKIHKDTVIEPYGIYGKIISMNLTGATLRANKLPRSKNISFKFHDENYSFDIKAVIKNVKSRKDYYEINVGMSNISLKQKKQLVGFFINHSVSKLFGNDFVNNPIASKNASLNLHIDSISKL